MQIVGSASVGVSALNRVPDPVSVSLSGNFHGMARPMKARRSGGWSYRLLTLYSVAKPRATPPLE
jgi:hypothetical protein